MKVKDSAVIIPQNEYIDRIRYAVDLVYKDFDLDPVCTSGQDSTVHKPGSMHYEGRALDIRFWDLLNVIIKRIKAHLPPYYDCIIENDHFHIEADKRKEARHVG